MRLKKLYLVLVVVLLTACSSEEKKIPEIPITDPPPACLGNPCATVDLDAQCVEAPADMDAYICECSEGFISNEITCVAE